MATLWIAELANSGSSPHTGFIPAMRMPPVTDQVVTFTTAQQSAAFNGSTRFIRVVANSICHLAFGNNPTATTASAMRLPADAVEYYGVEPGSLLSVIEGT